MLDKRIQEHMRHYIDTEVSTIDFRKSQYNSYRWIKNVLKF